MASMGSSSLNSDLSISAEVSLFGFVFRGSFQQDQHGISAMLGLRNENKNSKFSISNIPLVQSIAKVRGRSLVFLHIKPILLKF